MRGDLINTLAKVILLIALLPLVAMVLPGRPLTQAQAVMTWVLCLSMLVAWLGPAAILLVRVFCCSYPKA
jgi:hypothetical protein